MKRILILIHPDCIIEVGNDQTKRYIDLLKSNKDKFDYIISHIFFPSDHLEWMKTKRPNNFIDPLIQTINEISDKVKEAGTCSFEKELPDYLINNDNVEIYMGGGYEDNCLWAEYTKLFKKLKWLIKEKNIKVYWYKPLIFQDFRKDYFDRDKEEIETDKKHPELVDATPRTFHPSKIDYKETTFKSWLKTI